MKVVFRRFGKLVIESVAVYVIVPVVRAFGRNRLERLAANESFINMIQFIIRKILKKKNRYLENNINAILGVNQEQGILEFKQQLHRNLVHTIFDSFELDNQVISKTTFSGLEHIEESDNGFIFMSIHIGSYEVIRKNIELLGHNPHAIMNTFGESLFDPYCYNTNNRIGKSIDSQNPREILQAFKSDKDLTALIDVKVKNKQRSHKVPFCHQPAWTSSVLINLAQKYQKKIVPVNVKRNRDGTFTQTFFPPIANDISEHDALVALNNHFTDWVMDAPANWLLWDTNRWGR